MLRVLFLALLCISTGAVLPHLSAAYDEPEIIVRLETERDPLPIYIAQLANENSGFDKSYVAQLEQVLRFDFSHNGMTKPIEVTAKRQENALKLLPLQQNNNAWLTDRVSYVILGSVQQGKLAVKLISLNGQWVKQAEEIALTGSLKDDRRQIHRLSDAFFKTMFGSNGIASSKLLYTVRNQKGEEKEWTSEVWECDYDGANARQVTEGAGYCVTPAYLPPKPGFAAQSYVYVSYLNGQPKLFFGSLKEKKGERIATLKSNQMTPALSPQRDAIAFISDITGNPDLFLMQFQPEKRSTDKPHQIFSARQAVQASPSFSPDGSQVAFVSSKDGTPRIYTIPIPTPGTPLKEIKPTLISRLNKDNTSPAWSPDGTKIAYASSTNGVRQIWVYDLLTRKERQLTSGSGSKENPSWGPDSLHLVFNNVFKDTSELYFINLNQKEAVKISSGKGEKRFPSWEPR